MAIKPVYQAWVILAKNNLQAQLLTRGNSLFFIFGKLLNFAFTVVLAFAIFKTTNLVSGYTLDQAIIFVMVFNIMESVSGFLFRAIYMFRTVLVRGDFDLDLVKPLPSFFRPLLSAPDFLDLPSILIQIIIFLVFLSRFQISVSLIQFTVFVVLILFGIIITFSLYLIIASFSILTTEIDNLMSIIRSVSRAGIMPTDIYTGPFKFIIDYIIPITFIITIPAKSLLGILHPLTALIALVFTAFSLLVSLYAWRSALRYYTSASS